MAVVAAVEDELVAVVDSDDDEAVGDVESDDEHATTPPINAAANADTAAVRRMTCCFTGFPSVVSCL